MDLQNINDARRRIDPYIRHTPLVAARPMKDPFAAKGRVYFKLESMQITGSFKARGAVNKLLTLRPEEIERGIITASGGNHGLGVAYAGWLAKKPATIYLSSNVPKVKADQLIAWGAHIRYAGSVWDEANNAALEASAKEGLAYIHPFADPLVIAGQGTAALEILELLPDVSVLLVPIGGGGLASGVSLAAKSINPKIRVIGVEPTGAPTLHNSLKAGHLIELESISTAANTLAPRTSDAINFEIIRQYVDDIVLVSDDQMRDASSRLWKEMSIAADLSGSATTAALLAGLVNVSDGDKVCILVSGAGIPVV
jgi:threonine dehydratase